MSQPDQAREILARELEAEPNLGYEASIVRHNGNGFSMPQMLAVALRAIEVALRSQGGAEDVERAARVMYLVGEDWDTKASFDSLPEYGKIVGAISLGPPSPVRRGSYDRRHNLQRPGRNRRDDEPPRRNWPDPKRLSTAIALIDKTISTARDALQQIADETDTIADFEGIRFRDFARDRLNGISRNLWDAPGENCELLAGDAKCSDNPPSDTHARGVLP